MSPNLTEDVGVVVVVVLILTIGARSTTMSVINILIVPQYYYYCLRNMFRTLPETKCCEQFSTSTSPSSFTTTFVICHSFR